MTVKADIVRDASCASDARGRGFHQRRVPFTPETEDSINEELLMKTNMMRIQEYPGDEERRA